jgi:hypothetical protein
VTGALARAIERVVIVAETGRRAYRQAVRARRVAGATHLIQGLVD